jgi:hypothetical protein
MGSMCFPSGSGLTTRIRRRTSPSRCAARRAAVNSIWHSRDVGYVSEYQARSAFDRVSP